MTDPTARSGPQSAAWIAMAHLVRRTGFGATGTQVDAALRSGPAAFVRHILTVDPASDPGATATPPPNIPAPTPVPRTADAATRAAANKARAGAADQITGWWVRRMVAVTEPFVEKLTFCWHNHFATSSQKVRDAGWMLAQNEKLRRLGRGSFRDLAMAVLVDAAMLDWLDGEDNVAGAANENLGREFMELFTLGHGDGYTETDVREGSRALTGWQIRRDGSTWMNPRRHDDGIKTFLGVTGNLDDVGYANAIFARPAAADYVAARTWGQLASDTPPDGASQTALGAALRRGWSIPDLLTAMFGSPAFAAAQNQIVVNPVEWLIGAVRALRVPVHDDTAARKLVTALTLLGQVPFRPPNVGGWPSGGAWLSSASVDVRMHTALTLVRSADLDSVSAATQSERVDAAGYLLGIGAFTARTRATLSDAVADPRMLVALTLNTPEYLTN